jgi:hypothetical protein
MEKMIVGGYVTTQSMTSGQVRGRSTRQIHGPVKDRPLIQERACDELADVFPTEDHRAATDTRHRLLPSRHRPLAQPLP